MPLDSSYLQKAIEAHEEKHNVRFGQKLQPLWPPVAQSATITSKFVPGNNIIVDHFVKLDYRKQKF